MSLAALVTALLTLFSGFGLGTLLMPVVAIFFPLDVAIAMTAVVHLANNLFKGGLVGLHADRGVVLRFGIPAVAAALVGAWLLGWLAGGAPLIAWSALGHDFEATWIGVVVGFVILGFVALELSPRAASLALDPRWLPLGGLVSGFFGGLSGHQGAFRSAFLVKSGLSKEAFLGTGVVCAVVDAAISRIFLYRVGDLTEDARAMCRNLAQATRVLAQGVAKLRRPRDHPDILPYCVEIHTCENEGDRLEQHALASLFDGRRDTTEIIKWKDIYEDLESAIDKCEDAANVLETLVLKST